MNNLKLRLYITTNRPCEALEIIETVPNLSQYLIDKAFNKFQF